MNDFEATEKAKLFNYLIGKRAMFPKTYDENYQEYIIKNVIPDRVGNEFDVYLDLEGTHGNFSIHNKRLLMPLEYFKQNWVILRRIDLAIKEVEEQHQIVVSIPKTEMSGHPYFIFSGGGLGGGSPLELDLTSTEEHKTHYCRIFNIDTKLRRFLELPDATLKAIVIHDGVKYQSNLFKTERKKTVLSR